MKQAEREITVLGRLRGSVVGAWIVLPAALVIYLTWQEYWGDGFPDSLYRRVFGDLTVPICVALFLAGSYFFCRMWRERNYYIHHDGMRLFKGSDGSWPLSTVREAMLTRNTLGIQSLRILVETSDGRTTTPELAKCYFLAEPPEIVRAAVSRLVNR